MSLGNKIKKITILTNLMPITTTSKKIILDYIFLICYLV